MTLKTLLNQIHHIDESILDSYLAHWKPVAFNRKDFITTEGKTERYLYFVVEGVQKSYFLKNGKEFIIAFSYDGSFSGGPKSFYKQAPSEVYLECITPSKLLRIHYDRHQEMLKRYWVLDTRAMVLTSF